jgi:hypothetical protein
VSTLTFFAGALLGVASDGDRFLVAVATTESAETGALSGIGGPRRNAATEAHALRY